MASIEIPASPNLDITQFIHSSGKKEIWQCEILGGKIEVYASLTPVNSKGVKKILEHQYETGVAGNGVVISGTHGSVRQGFGQGASILEKFGLHDMTFASEDQATVEELRSKQDVPNDIEVIDLHSWMVAYKGDANCVADEVSKALRKHKPLFIVKAWCYSQAAMPKIDEVISSYFDSLK